VSTSFVIVRLVPQPSELPPRKDQMRFGDLITSRLIELYREVAYGERPCLNLSVTHRAISCEVVCSEEIESRDHCARVIRSEPGT
jgi:hypothetical protein